MLTVLYGVLTLMAPERASSWLTDWVDDVNIPPDTKQVISETFFPANIFASTEKQNLKWG